MTTIPAYPLQWPAGWKRTPDHSRTHAKFSAEKKTEHRWSDGRTTTWKGRRELTIEEAMSRVRAELARMGVDDIVVSTNLALRLDGQPRSGQREPDDPGVAVYWRSAGGDTRCMAIDRYHRAADNIAAVAATLDAMRAIERHGGAEILDRAFTGFAALPGPQLVRAWHETLGVPAHASTEQVRDAYRRLRSQHHPDRGGDPEAFDEIEKAWRAVCAERGIE
jgi:hypothetical protein